MLKFKIYCKGNKLLTPNHYNFINQKTKIKWALIEENS